MLHKLSKELFRSIDVDDDDDDKVPRAVGASGGGATCSPTTDTGIRLGTVLLRLNPVAEAATAATGKPLEKWASSLLDVPLVRIELCVFFDVLFATVPLLVRSVRNAKDDNVVCCGCAVVLERARTDR